MALYLGSDKKSKVVLSGYNKGYDKGYEEGKKSATMSGTISFTNATKILTITGLHSAPKKFSMYATQTTIPTDNTQYFIRGMDYEAEGYGTTTRWLATLYLTVNKNVSATSAGNGAVTESNSNKHNIFTFADGTFTIDMSYHDKYIFGENFTYNWTAIL